MRLFNLAVDRVAPFCDVRVKAKSNPWMNQHILSGIKLRDSLLSKLRKDRGNVFLHKEYNRVRNAVQRDIKTAKQTYFGNMVERNRGDPKKLRGQLRALWTTY